MKTIPDNVNPYKSTPVFTHETVPKGLLKDHKTAPDVWGLIHVEEGQLEYTIGENEVHVLTPEGSKGVVAPEELHRVKPLGEVKFKVEFHR